MSQWKASGLTDTAVVVRETEKEAEILLSALISAGPELRLMETGKLLRDIADSNFFVFLKWNQ